MQETGRTDFLELSRKESGCYPTLGTIRTSFSDLLYASPMTQEIIMSIRKGFHKNITVPYAINCNYCEKIILIRRTVLICAVSLNTL